MATALEKTSEAISLRLKPLRCEGKGWSLRKLGRDFEAKTNHLAGLLKSSITTRLRPSATNARTVAVPCRMSKGGLLFVVLAPTMPETE